MAVLAYTSAFSALVCMSNCTCRLLKTNFVILKDTAFISSKSRLNLCRHGLVISVTQTDRRTDGFSALYSRLASVPALSCRCIYDLTYLVCYTSQVYLVCCSYLPSFAWLVFSTYLVYLPMAIAT